MYFESWQEIWSMKGHGIYVWVTYLMTFIALMGLVVSSFWRLTRFKKSFIHKLAREQMMKDIENDPS